MKRALEGRRWARSEERGPIRLVFLVSLVIQAGVLISCDRQRVSSLAEERRHRETVRTVYAVSQTVTPALRTFGTITHLNKADIYPTTEGTLESLLTEEGDLVENGQPLAQLNQDRLVISKDQVTAAIQSKRALVTLAKENLAESRRAVEARILAIQSAEAELAQRRAEFENAQTVYDNKKRLFDVGGISEGELETVKTGFLGAQTALSRAENDLSIQMIGFRDQDIVQGGYEVPAVPGERKRILVELNTRKLAAEVLVAQSELGASLAEQRRIDLLLDETTIRSPITGLIGARLMDLGEKASPETLLFTVLNIEQVYAQVDVSEGDLSSIRIGQSATLTTEGRSQEGRVQLISPFIDPQTRTSRVRILAENQNRDLIPGQFVRVEILIGLPAERVTIPEEAVLTDQNGQTTAFLVRDGLVFRREIQVDWVDEDTAILSSGLQRGDEVTLNPAFSYRDGMEVEVLE